MISNLFNNPFFVKVLWSLLIIIIGVIVYKIIIGGIVRGLDSTVSKNHSNKKAKTYARLVKSIIRYIFIIGICLIILDIFGINISSIIAGVGVFGVIFGLAIQDWLKDIIRGSSIISDNYFSVGDVIKYKDIEAKVIVIGLKTTKVKDIRTNNVISVSNRNIDEVQVLSSDYFVKIPMPYELSVSKSEEIINIIVDRVNKIDLIDECEYKGVSCLADSSILYLLHIRSNPISRYQAEREVLRNTLLVFEENNISVQYNQIDVHNK